MLHKLTLLLCSIALLFACKAQQHASPTYVDTTIVVPAMYDTLCVDTLYNVPIVFADSSTIVIQHDTITRFKIQYKRAPITLRIDSVRVQKTIVINKVQRIHVHSCNSQFHNFCVGFFILSACALVLRITLNALL